MTSIADIYSFLHSAEQLKNELRHSYTSTGRRESVAEHTWRMSLMAMLLSSRLEKKVNLEKLLKMIIIHDIVEIEAGDTPVPFMQGNDELKKQKEIREKQAIENVKNHLGEELGAEIHQLWYEFEAQETYEAKVAYALDKLEVQIQHNEADIKTWISVEYELIYSRRSYTSFDRGLDELRALIETESEKKLTEAGITLHRPSA